MKGTTEHRAGTAINAGTVRLWNQWLERRWSAFTGGTTELHLLPDQGDCLTRRSPEYHLDYGNRSLAVMDLGDVSWSDHCDAYGASVRLEQTGPGIRLRVETFLSHSHPAMIRSATVTNTSGSAVSIARIASDVLPIDPARFQPDDSTPRSVLLDPHTMYYRPLEGKDRCLWFGATKPDGFALFAPNSAYCAPVWQGDITLDPGQHWEAPPVALYAAVQAPWDALLPAINGLHATWAEHRSREDYPS